MICYIYHKVSPHLSAESFYSSRVCLELKQEILASLLPLLIEMKLIKLFGKFVSSAIVLVVLLSEIKMLVSPGKGMRKLPWGMRHFSRDLNQS